MSERYFSPRLSALAPYTPGEQPRDKRYIKLNTNENPYPPSPKVKDAVLKAAEDLRLYPDPNSALLCETIAEDEGVAAQNVFCGNGSDEVLSFVFCAFFGGDSPLFFPDITYSFYPVYARFYGIMYKELPLNQNLEINADDYLNPACGIIFPNPNAPTSVYLDTSEVIKIAEYHKNTAVVVIDEAYIAFGGESMVKYIKQYPNLLIIRTLSKSHSLAGLRLGYCIGAPHLIEAVRSVKDSFNSYPVDRLAAAAAIAAIKDTRYCNEQIQKVKTVREQFSDSLLALGFNVLPASGNFVFCSHASFPAGRLKAELMERGILVRHFDKPRINNYLRISIGEQSDMRKLLSVLDELTGKGVKS